MVVLVPVAEAVTSTSTAVMATRFPACHTMRYSGASLSVAKAVDPSSFGTVTAESSVAWDRATVSAAAADAFELQFKTSEIRPVFVAVSS